MKTKCCDCCYPEIVNSDACECCEGVEILTPLATANRPGLSELIYRIGTHASFLETMKARLSSSDYSELVGLTTRDAGDASIALLDSWATVADVLTFYQERVANEAYLRTATERRSILELARLVGYKLRPGVAASVYIAYTLDDKFKEETIIPAGSRVQSIPGPDELPQVFETSEELKVRARWNNLKPRMTQPQTALTIRNGTPNSSVRGQRVYLKGINTNLNPNDPLLIGFGSGTPQFHRVKAVIPDANADRTLITIQDGDEGEEEPQGLLNPVQLINELALRPSLQPANTLRLGRKLEDQFTEKAGTGYQTVSSFSPRLRETLTLAVANARVAPESELKLYALRVNASLFGHNAPREPRYEPSLIPGGGDIATNVPNPNAGNLRPQPWPEWRPEGESENMLHLDRVYEQIVPDSYIVVQNLDQSEVFETTTVQSISRNAYGISGETTRITLNRNWWAPDSAEGDISEIRSTKVYAQPEELEMADEPIEVLICGGRDDLIELDGFFEGLESGRWVIVSGEREIKGTMGVRFSELAMLSSVTQDVVAETQGATTDDNDNENRSGEKIHTFIKLASELAYCFKRDTVTIYGNVVKATHGETSQEILGSGDGSKALQSFDTKLKPLTYVSASNPTGVDSTLEVFVNDIRWHEADTLADRQSTDRNFIMQTDDDDNTTITFGNGKKGARLPSGVENIKAEYRSGIGKPGNVKADQISLLKDKPLGVKEVINPLRASGGANREGRDQARKNAPLAIKALDRLVSVQDYEDFSRTYAGIGKARAVELSNGRRQLVHVTIAGAEDIPIDTNSDLYRNLRRALYDFGDPFQSIELAVRELMLIVVSANVRIQPDYQWEPVVTEMRDTLLNAFSFERRELGQDVLLSEMISVMQAVPGVAYVDIDSLGGIPEKKAEADERRLLTPEEITGTILEFVVDSEEANRPIQRLPVYLADRKNDVIRPAQLAFLTPEVPETLILNQIE